jgi:hypothetical protein
VTKLRTARTADLVVQGLALVAGRVIGLAAEAIGSRTPAHRAQANDQMVRRQG